MALPNGQPSSGTIASIHDGTHINNALPLHPPTATATHTDEHHELTRYIEGLRSNYDDNRYETSVNSANTNTSHAPHTTHHITHELDDDINQRTMSTMLSAAYKNDINKLQSIISLNNNAVHMADYNSTTALHIAATQNNLAACKLLIDTGSDINALDRHHNTPLDDAVNHGHIDLANYLKSKGAIHGNLSKLQIDLIHAASNGDIVKVKRLLDSGVPVDSADYDLRSSLHLAVAENNLDMTRLLLEHGANPNAQDRFGTTPMQDALRQVNRTGIDAMVELFKQYGAVDAKHTTMFSSFTISFIAFQILLCIFFGIFTVYDPTNTGGIINAASVQGYVNQIYPFFADVQVMIFVGFGFLMVFLRKHGYSSSGMTFLLAAFCIEWYQLTSGFWMRVFSSVYDKLPLNIYTLINGEFNAAAILITFGVVLGKTTPAQMMYVAFIETIMYSLNQQIGIRYGATDLGGTITIHLFGAVFGVALSLILTKRGAVYNSIYNSASYNSDIFSILGTMFLWIFWPSFNAATGVGATQSRAIVNTVLSLCGSCVTAFLCSHIMRKEQKFAMVDIQNATLAGGVAMGACCDLIITPGAAISIGSIAGFVSVAGFVYIQPFLDRTIGLSDTCGVQSLHGYPSLVGGLASVIAVYMATYDTYGDQLYISMPMRDTRNSSIQAAYQFAYICTTIGIAALSGVISGLIIKNASLFTPLPHEMFYSDAYSWETPQLEEPYAFDIRGEVLRGVCNTAVDGSIEPNTQKPNDIRIDVQNDKERAHYVSLANKIKSLEAQLNSINKSQLVNQQINSQSSHNYNTIDSSRIELLFDKLLHRLDERDRHV